MSPRRVEVTELVGAEEITRLDPDTLDPTKVYRFLQERRENLARKQALGYELVRRSETSVRLIHEEDGEGSADDLIRVGDTVLAMIDKTKYNSRRRQVQNLSAARLGAKEASFKSQAQKRGVRTVTGEEGE